MARRGPESTKSEPLAHGPVARPVVEPVRVAHEVRPARARRDGSRGMGCVRSTRRGPDAIGIRLVETKDVVRERFSEVDRERARPSRKPEPIRQDAFFVAPQFRDDVFRLGANMA
jgi:hypothetical protein